MTSNNQPTWQTGRVVSSVAVASDVRRITVERPPVGRAAPGAHVDVRVPIGGDTDIRSYSVVDSNDTGDRTTISVLRVSQSRGGSAYMHRLVAGDELVLTQPMQNFPLRVGAPRYVLLAGGIGITALMDMARVLRGVRADYTLVYAGRSRDRMAYLDDLAALHGPRLQVHVANEGRLLDVAELVRSIDTGPWRGATELYMCGPIRLMDTVRRDWEGAALPTANLRFETFGSSGWYQSEEFVARIPRLGIEATVGPQETLLDALTRAGADLMYDCRRGECGLCVLDVGHVAGTIDHRDVFLSAAQKSSRRSITTCVSRVAPVSPDSTATPTLSLSLP